MTLEIQTWDDLGDDTLIAWGNGYALLTTPDKPFGERVLVLNWQESPQGTLHLFRNVCADEDAQAFVPVLWRSLAKDQWTAIANEGFVMDREAIATQIEAQRAAAAERLGLPPGAVPMNRQQRRQLERVGSA